MKNQFFSHFVFICSWCSIRLCVHFLSRCQTNQQRKQKNLNFYFVIVVYIVTVTVRKRFLPSLEHERAKETKKDSLFLLILIVFFWIGKWDGDCRYAFSFCAKSFPLKCLPQRTIFVFPSYIIPNGGSNSTKRHCTRASTKASIFYSIQLNLIPVTY